jgi:biotin-[acetyl-CoA-carboxylase] ligase BirA-like protein
MIVFADNKQYAESILIEFPLWRRVETSGLEPELRNLCERIFAVHSFYQTNMDMKSGWQYACLVENALSSQYDRMVEMCKQDHPLPDGLICLAGSGQNFHGQRGRPWAARPGNIHLTACFAPNKSIDRYDVGFSLLAAVSVLDTIDALGPLTGRAGIKWVNDILIEGVKVAGFLTHTSGSGDTVESAVLGIGLNVETTPRISTDEVTPRAASLRDYVPDAGICNQRNVLNHLLHFLDKNYLSLLSGQFAQFLTRYRRRSIIIGRRVKIVSDPKDGPEREIAAGRVRDIGDNLELFLDGVAAPVTKGRLILTD